MQTQCFHFQIRQTINTTVSPDRGNCLQVDDVRGGRRQWEYLSPLSYMHMHLQVNPSQNCFWTLLLPYLSGISNVLVKSQDPHLEVYFTWVASRIKSWMIICSSLERHSLSLLIRVTVKASQFMDSSRLGQYTNSSSAWRNETTHCCSLSDTLWVTEESSGSKNWFDK